MEDTLNPDTPRQLSPDSLHLFAELLAQVQVSGGQPNFDEVCSRISLARKEVAEALSGLPAKGKVSALAGKGAAPAPAKAAPNRAARRHPPKGTA